MMDWVRKNVALIAGFTVGVMVLWLVGTAVTIRSTRAPIAGTLFGRKVSLQAYSKALDAVTRQALLSHGDKYRQEVKPEELERMAWQRLTLLEEARRRHIEVSDKELIDYLQKWPLFQRNGEFDPASYEALIRYSLGTTPRQFEEEIRELLMIIKLTESATHTAVTDDELQEAYRKKAETIKVSYMIVPKEAEAKEIAEAVRQNPRALEESAQRLKIPVKTTDFVTRTTDIPELGQAEVVFKPLFALAIGETAGPLQSAKGWLVARLEAKNPADPTKFDAEKEALRNQLMNQKKFKVYFAWYSELIKRANLQEALPAQVSHTPERKTTPRQSPAGNSSP